MRDKSLELSLWIRLHQILSFKFGIQIELLSTLTLNQVRFFSYFSDIARFFVEKGPFDSFFRILFMILARIFPFLPTRIMIGLL